jgi:hypothetical protein
MQQQVGIPCVIWSSLSLLIFVFSSRMGIVLPSVSQGSSFPSGFQSVINIAEANSFLPLCVLFPRSMRS